MWEIQKYSARSAARTTGLHVTHPRVHVSFARGELLYFPTFWLCRGFIPGSHPGERIPQIIYLGCSTRSPPAHSLDSPSPTRAHTCAPVRGHPFLWSLPMLSVTTCTGRPKSLALAEEVDKQNNFELPSLGR